MSNLFTAHCRFGVTLTGVKNAEDALTMFEKLDIVLVGADFNPMSSHEQEGVKNWKGIDFCPPVHGSPNGYPPSRDDEFEVYAYIKVFLDVADVGQAREQLDQLNLDVRDGKPFLERECSSSGLDFSIDPSVGEDLNPANRISPSGSAAKAWQKAPEIAAEDRIAPSDPPLEAARKASRQFKRALQPFELSWIFKANGIDLSTEAAWEISQQLAKAD